MKLYDEKLLSKQNIGLFNGNLEDKLYRFSLKSIPKEHCLVCKKLDNKEYLIVCDRCLINQVHYYCDEMIGLYFGCYICPICRNRYYQKNKKINKKEK